MTSPVFNQHELTAKLGLNQMNPSQDVRLARQDGWLAKFFPELDALWGVPQNPEHHPEVDTGTHIELTVDVAAKLTLDPMIVFAALVHDLGKGTTPKDELPKHISHELRGVPLVHAVCDRFNLPDTWRKLGSITAQWHLQAHRALELSPKRVVKLFRDAGFFDRPELLNGFLIACEADKRGRAGRELTLYPQADFLFQCFEAARVVRSSVIKLHQDRCDAVRAVMPSALRAAESTREFFTRPTPEPIEDVKSDTTAGRRPRM